jgi:16S rRNA (cytidine1402-2'-O)-methyltransferase
MSTDSTVYLIPTYLDEESLHVLPAYLSDAVKECQVFFVENERTARRFLKKIWKDMVIDQYEWHPVHKVEEEAKVIFRKRLKEGKTIGIISEAGCPGVADPGQILVEAAQEAGAKIRPLVGPSSVLLALMASGMNGQEFHFAGYLPVDSLERSRKIRELEQESRGKNCTEIFIETPYRNNQLLEALLRSCQPQTRLCIAVDLTGKQEDIRTMTIAAWKEQIPDLAKRPAIFLLHASTR